MRIFEKSIRNTKIGQKGIEANITAVDYINKNNIPGSIVECGVWRGGSIAAMLYRLVEHNDITRNVYLFDTFTGMSEPSEYDEKTNTSPENTRLRHEDNQKEFFNIWDYAPLADVQETINETNYPNEKINYVKGKVEDTLPTFSIDKIAILRLDTDFYESTKVELECLYPKVSEGGVVIIDDYGVWRGAKKAVDEYFTANDIDITLIVIDAPRRYFYKPPQQSKE